MIKPHHILKLNTIARKLGSRQFITRIYGEWFKFQDAKGSATPHIVYEEISRGYYTPQGKLLPGDTVVDLGAHVGMFTIPLARKHPQVQFVCVEPDTENFRNLAFNVKRAGLTNVLLLHLGLWDSECELKSNHNTSNTGGSHTVESGVGECPGMTWHNFRKLFNLQHIKLLKMDIEGAEFRIIQDPTDLNGIDEVMAEIHGGAGNEYAMSDLLETVSLSRLQLIHGNETYSSRENGGRYIPKGLEAYCANCGDRLSFWNIPGCRNMPPGYNCVPA